MLMKWSEAATPRLVESDPYENLRRAMDRLFTDIDRQRDPLLPRLQLREDADALSVQVELPGFEKDDVCVDLNHDTLTVRGQRETTAPEGYATHRSERGTMSFARSFRLPCRVDAQHVEAKLRDGILELYLPKVAEEKPRTIDIN